MKPWNARKCEQLLAATSFMSPTEFDEWCQACIDELKVEIHGDPSDKQSMTDSVAPDFVQRASLIALQLEANELALQCDPRAISSQLDGIRVLNECIKWCDEELKRKEPTSDEPVPAEKERSSWTLERANIAVPEYLKNHHDATKKEIADALDCSTGLVFNTWAWKAVSEKRKIENPPKKKTVSYGKREENQHAQELHDLTVAQRKDEIADARPPGRRQAQDE